MIYDVSHLTRYQYDAPVAVNVCVLRLLPRSEDGQRVLEAGVEVTPRPLTLIERTDAFANRVLKLRIETPHRELTLHSRARVVVERPAPPLAALTPTWENVAALAASAASLEADAPAAGEGTGGGAKGTAAGVRAPAAGWEHQWRSEGTAAGSGHGGGVRAPAAGLRAPAATR